MRASRAEEAREGRRARSSSFADLGNVGLLEGEPVLRPAEDVVDLADVEAHLEELALHQAVPQLEEGLLRCVGWRGHAAVEARDVGGTTSVENS